MYAWNSNLQLQIELPSTFSEIALNDKEGRFLDKESIFSLQGQCLLEQCIYDIDYMLLKMTKVEVFSLTMRAGARFTVSPFGKREVCCLIVLVVLVFTFFTGPISLESFRSIGCKNYPGRSYCGGYPCIPVER